MSRCPRGDTLHTHTATSRLSGLRDSPLRGVCCSVRGPVSTRSGVLGTRLVVRVVGPEEHVLFPTPREAMVADDVWPVVHAERRALADDLAGLTAEQWRTPSLSEGRTGEQTPAHKTAAGEVNPAEAPPEKGAGGLPIHPPGP